MGKIDSMTIPLDRYIDGFRNNFAIGRDALLKAAQNYAQALLRHPTLAAERFAQEFPGVSQRTWDILERIGNGDLNVNAFYLPYVTARRIAHIPADLQARLFADSVKGVKVVSASTGKTKTIPIQTMSDAQAQLVFDIKAGRVRTEAEQKKIIASQNASILRSESVKRGRPPKYEVRGSVCIIGGIEIGRETLRKILAEMDAAKSGGTNERMDGIG